MTPAVVLPHVLSIAGFLGLGDWTAKPSPAAEAAIVVIRTANGGGSGFLAELDGKKYIITNQHVLMGAAAGDVRITFIDGTVAHPTNPQIVGDLDLARLELETDRTALKCAAGTPETGAKIFAVGNSLDAGVITTGEGRIQGVGASEIEVDCDFVPGNSGGPVLDTASSVLAVSTYIRLGEANAVTAGTRYAKNRRFAVRLRDGMTWTAIPQWQTYAAAGARIQNAQQLGEEVVLAAQAIATNSDPGLFQPRTQKVASAIGDLDRLRSRFSKLSANGLTARELQTNRSTLAATYRSAFQKLREACATAMRDLNATPVPPAWGWLNGECQRSIKQLELIQALLDREIKKEPPF